MAGRSIVRATSREAIQALLHPRAVALIGASNDENKIAGQPVRNLLTGGFTGGIYPVNRRGGAIHGVESVVKLTELPDDVDVAFVTVPAAACEEAVRGLGEAGVPVAVIAVSGFAELGTDEGRQLQIDLASAANDTGVRLVGPNCNGVYETRQPLALGYNVVHSKRLRPGSVALVSHSGALVGGFVPRLEFYGQGLSAFVSCGNEVDLELTDYLDYFVDDPDTSVIALIMDGVSNGARFRSAVQRARKANKPIVALKLGNTASGTQAAQAHTSRLAGSKMAYDAIFSADGVVSVPTLETLALACAVLAAGRRPTKPGVVGTSTSGAGCILLADALGSVDIPLTRFSHDTQTAMEKTAGFAQVMNPFDIGAAGSASIRVNLDRMMRDPHTGAFLFYLTPAPTVSWRDEFTEAIAAAARAFADLPIIVISPSDVTSAEQEALAGAGVPIASSLLDAVTVLRSLMDVYGPVAQRTTDEAEPKGSAASALSEPASKRFLADRGVSMMAETVVNSEEAAVAAATPMGYPLVLKASGRALTHKSEHHLVALDVRDEATLRIAFNDLHSRGQTLDPLGYEGVTVMKMIKDGVDVLLGFTVDADFGPMIVFGAGGVLAELVGDVSAVPAPVNEQDARTLINSTKVSRVLEGYRGAAPCDIDALVDLIVQLSEIAVAEVATVQAVDLNPIRVLPAGQGIAILDALVIPRVECDVR